MVAAACLVVGGEAGILLAEEAYFCKGHISIFKCSDADELVAFCQCLQV